jgi:hypothetical protein
LGKSYKYVAHPPSRVKALSLELEAKPFSLHLLENYPPLLIDQLKQCRLNQSEALTRVLALRPACLRVWPAGVATALHNDQRTREKFMMLGQRLQKMPSASIVNLRLLVRGPLTVMASRKAVSQYQITSCLALVEMLLLKV